MHPEIVEIPLDSYIGPFLQIREGFELDGQTSLYILCDEEKYEGVAFASTVPFCWDDVENHLGEM